MTMVYGVFDPGVPAGCEPCGMLCDSAAKAYFTRFGVPSEWGQPTACCVWTDTNTETTRVAVANYSNGKSAILRFFRGKFELTFGDAP